MNIKTGFENISIQITTYKSNNQMYIIAFISIIEDRMSTIRNILLLFFFLITSFMIGQNNKINSDCIHPVDTIDGLIVLTFVEKMPEYKGGDQKLMKYLIENIQYPTLENTDDLQFKIFATFVIDTVGKVRNPCILRPKYTDRQTLIETELIRVIDNMPNWYPGVNNGKKVPVRLQLPISIDWK